jgi:hypothetical protein
MREVNALTALTLDDLSSAEAPGFEVRRRSC